MWRDARRITHADVHIRRGTDTTHAGLFRGFILRNSDVGAAALSAILRTAVKWRHLTENPARGADLPELTAVKPKWALTAGTRTTC